MCIKVDIKFKNFVVIDSGRLVQLRNSLSIDSPDVYRDHDHNFINTVNGGDLVLA